MKWTKHLIQMILQEKSFGSIVYLVISKSFVNAII